VGVGRGPPESPHPPFYFSANSLESAPFAAAPHFGLGVSFSPPHVTAQMTGHYKQECAKHGWEPTSEQLLYRAFIAVGEDDKEAAALQAKYFVGDATGNFFRGRGAAVPPPTQTQAGFGLGELRFCGGPGTGLRQVSDFPD